MATPKRERQRQNRELRLAEEASTAKKESMKRRLQNLTLLFVVLGMIGVVIFAYAQIEDDSDTSDDADTSDMPGTETVPDTDTEQKQKQRRI